MKVRQGSDRFLTWLQETKGLEVRALSLTRNGGLVRRKVWQRMVPEENLRGMSSCLVKRKVGLRSCSEESLARNGYSTLFFSPYIASAGWAPNNHPIT